MEQRTVFISHSTTNDAQTDRIADALEHAGFSVWVDHRNGIKPGTPSWDKAIRAAIEDADVGVFIMSEAALASEICGSECLLVRELGDPLYIVKLEDVKPSSVWLYIKQIQYADLTKNYDEGIESLINALNGKPTANSPQALHSRFTGESTLRQYLPFLFLNPMRGRDDDLRRLTASLNGTVVQVTGTGGLGKSRLVAEAALNHAQGAVWYRCSSLSTPADLLGLLMEHLRLPQDSAEQDMLNQLRLRPKTLIVIDNAEDVLPENQISYLDFIAKLQTAGAHIVLTSRMRWETLRPLNEITPTALDLVSATAIARDFAVAQNIPLTDAEAEAIALEARLYPRLIEWAIGQFGKRPFERVLAQLHDLKSKGVQEALDEMIRSSIDQMSAQDGDSAERLLLRLAVCQGSFGYQVINALKPGAMDEDLLDDALDVLQAWRFVRYERSDERYSVDPMVRLALPAPDETTHRAHFLHYKDLYSNHAANNNEDTHPRILLDWDDIQAALTWGMVHETETAIDWVIALQHFMLLRRTNLERFEMLTRALETAINTDYEWGEANCLKALGDVHLRKNEYAEAVERYQEALPLY
ncbi:MAG: TIR domain-containing protein, partial [Anaerolineae bacterium]|nr:TIR domain-containing protein [Anaerolineae bacterium]